MENKNYKLSIVVPCYNEAGNIPLIINRFKEIIGSRKDIEVILVNNGSKDNSEEIFDEQLKKFKLQYLKVLGIPVNQGYGYGILEGLKASNGNVMAWTHADMQTDPKDVLTAFEKFKMYNSEQVFIKGKRKKQKLDKVFFTLGMQIIASLVLRVYLDDINAQPKLFSRKFYEKYLVGKAPTDFSLDLYAQYFAKKQGKIIEIPVYFDKRMHGEAKGGGSFKTRIKLIKRTFSYIFELKREIKKVQF